MPDGSHPERDTRTPMGAWDRLMVCVVSSDAWTADLVRAACDPSDFDVRVLPRDDEALRRVERLSPAVIAVDITGGDRLPFDLLRALQAGAETQSTPTLALAAAPDPLVRAAAFAAGVEDFAHRGTDPEELRSRVRTLGRLSAAARRALDAESALSRLQQRVRERDRELEATRRLISQTNEAMQADNRTQRGRVESMVQVGLELNKVQDFHVLMDRILREARALIHAEAGTIFLREGRVLRFAYSQNDALERAGGEQPRFSGFMVPTSDTSIAGWVAASGEPVNVRDAYQIDPASPFRFDPSFDRMTGYRTRGVLAMPLRTSSGTTLGVLQLLNAMDERGRPRDRFSEGDEGLLAHFASMATVAIDRSELMKNIVRRMLLMAHAHDEVETWPHVTRVSEVSAVLFDEWARRRGLMEGSAYERQRDRLRNAAKMHDLGKVGISTGLLRKPGPLTPEEYEDMKRHVVIGARLFMEHPTEFDEAARDVALNHHERWDGSGYPGHVDLAGTPLVDPSSSQPRRGGKRGEEIPLFARIVAVADVYDALSHRRTYKEAWDEKRVLNTMRAEKGRHFDPELVEIFFERLPEISEVREAHPG